MLGAVPLRATVTQDLAQDITQTCLVLFVGTIITLACVLHSQTSYDLEPNGLVGLTHRHSIIASHGEAPSSSLPLVTPPQTSPGTLRSLASLHLVGVPHVRTLHYQASLHLAGVPPSGTLHSLTSLPTAGVPLFFWELFVPRPPLPISGCRTV